MKKIELENIIIDTISEQLINENIDEIKKHVSNILRNFTSDAKREILRYKQGFKGEGRNLKIAFDILEKFRKNRSSVTHDEKEFFKHQILDLLKTIGVIVPIQLIPAPFVSTILLLVLEKLFEMMKIQLLPSSFYNQQEPQLSLVKMEQLTRSKLKQLIKEVMDEKNDKPKPTIDFKPPNLDTDKLKAKTDSVQPPQELIEKLQKLLNTTNKIFDFALILKTYSGVMDGYDFEFFSNGDNIDYDSLDGTPVLKVEKEKTTPIKQ